jgi:pyruvate formate lyase activating enzyme
MEVKNGRPIFHREKIRNPRKLADACPTGALAVLGEEKSVADIVKEIEKDLPFFKKSGGGVTLSGGEPYDQPVFLQELLRALKPLNVTAAVETTLNVPWSAIEPSLPMVRTFLVDIKHFDPVRLRALTGGDLSLICANLRMLQGAGAQVIARVPIIPGFNDSPSDVAGIVDLAASVSNIRIVHFLPFHTLGVSKYHLLGKDYRFLAQGSPAGDMSEYLTLARRRGLEASIGG